MDLEEETGIKWFCPEPYANIMTDTTGSYKPCCASVGDGYEVTTKTHSPIEAMNSPKAKEFRKAFIDGKIPDACSTCVKQEQNNIKSHRQWYIDRYKQGSDDEFGSEFGFQAQKIADLAHQVKQDPNADIKPEWFHSMEHTAAGGNYCNLKCAMCAASCSSSFAKESYELNEMQGVDHFMKFGKHKYQPEVNDSVHKEMEYILPRLGEIKLTGGEPLAIPYNYDLLQKAIDIGCADQQILRIITNGTLNASIKGKSIFDLIPHFRKVIFNISIESWGKRNDYIRYPSDFNTVLSNASRYADDFVNTDVTFVSTINALNIGHIDEMYTKAKQHGSDFLDSVAVSYVVHDHPTGMNIAAVPDDIKEQYLDHYYNLPYETAKRIQSYIKLLEETEHNPRTTKILMNRMKNRDQLRSTNLLELWPEWEPYYV
jgi:MoaA/NifB/PqqE/SkfB family radical SAM enzyme